MIENIIYKILTKDDILKTLLDASEADSKIYLNAFDVKQLPCIIYRAQSPVSPNSEAWAYQQTITMEIRTELLNDYSLIQKRLYEIFNKFDGFFNSDSMNAGIIIRECHSADAQSQGAFQLNENNAVTGIISFDFKFTKCA